MVAVVPTEEDPAVHTDRVLFAVMVTATLAGSGVLFVLLSVINNAATIARKVGTCRPCQLALACMVTHNTRERKKRGQKKNLGVRKFIAHSLTKGGRATRARGGQRAICVFIALPRRRSGRNKASGQWKRAKNGRPLIAARCDDSLCVTGN